MKGPKLVYKIFALTLFLFIGWSCRSEYSLFVALFVLSLELNVAKLKEL